MGKTRSRKTKIRRKTRRRQRGGGIGAREINKAAVVISKRVEKDEGGVEDIQRL
jgi:hypothetical protein